MSSAHGPQFERYIGVDYSGAAKPTSGRDGLRIFAATADSEPTEFRPLLDAKRHWTRAGVAEWLQMRLREPVPTLVGIDHAFSFPVAYFQKYGLPANWPAFLEDFQRHWPTDRGRVRDVRSAARSGEPSWLRLTEQRAGGAKSVFRFGVQGEVATSTHAGLPWLRFLRDELGGLVSFWPFDGWEVPVGRSAVVEVYPALFRDAGAHGDLNEHQRDAFNVAAWLRRADRRGELGSFLAPPLDASERDLASIEGWILGVMEGREKRPKVARAVPSPGPVMQEGPPTGFPPGVAERLKTYVYRLIDPRSGETFYVGKGKGDRVFAHIRLAGALDGDAEDNKLKQIREIHLAGLEVGHVIHRHGLDDATAFEVEAALMDAYPGLTNVAGGVGNNDFGTMHAKEIIARYNAEPAVFHHRALLISVNRSVVLASLYDAVRYAWKIDPDKARRAEVILATLRGMIVGAFVADAWLEATSENFPGFEAVQGRYAFNGGPASDELRKLYVGKRVPDEYRRPGAANPIKYTWR